MSTILTCLWHFWTEGQTHNNGIKNPQPLDADPSAPNHKNYSEYANTGASPNLPLTGDTLFTDEGIPIFEM